MVAKVVKPLARKTASSSGKPVLQSIVQAGRKALPRGWAPLLKTIAQLSPHLQNYRARIGEYDYLHVDLRQSMCLVYFFHNGLPHERGTEVLLRKALRPGDTFIDVGANVGFYTRMGSLIVGGGGRVIAFEPMPTALRLLRMNSADLSNVTVEAKALSDHEGVAKFYIRGQGDTSSLSPGSSAQQVQVEVTTLDNSLFREESHVERVDFIKIDVEGLELSVLRGATNTISKHQPIVYFEFLPEYAKHLGFAFEDFAKFFNEFNYTLHWTNHDANRGEVFSAQVSNYITALPARKRGLVSANQLAMTI